ncbi:EAL and HDOD domain-containing protein [Desulfogranum marinum]|uniref:EAL and HDOD domain-containing protein n=1 Tax=Desulfogranum marinum TaxID=453220 RepID=UPI001965CB92|nr:HDOD domain-containing protein [Desulfogranum marinum]MBM9514369.1 EAL domain-containing protein [Desulfogranum marinum]
MEQYIARQPIFNLHKKVYAYELLYRGAKHYSLDKVSGNRATTSLLSSAFLTRDIQDISSFKPCFINFTQDLLEKKLPESFSKESVVVEILEDVEPTPQVVQACQQLHNKGYTLALDDFVYDRKFIPLLQLADIVKIDFRLTPHQTILRTLNILARYKVKLLAEKVETLEEFEAAAKLGFVYFQGYFFSKPEQIKIEELSTTQITHLRLLAEVTKKSTTIDKLHNIIANDISVSYKLLRFLNSSYFYRLQEIKSVKQAIAYLGIKELRHFVMLVIISEMTTSKPGELVRLGLVRAKFCELLGENSDRSIESSELFVVGLFSLLDAMLNAPMIEIMDRLPVSNGIKEALLTDTGPYCIYLELVKNYERNNEALFVPLFERLELDPEKVNTCYLTAIKYANGLL